MGNKRTFYKLTALIAVLGLIFAASASAYTVPKPPGSSGGPPTAPTKSSGGSGKQNSQNQAGATALGTTIAGYTPAELVSIQSFAVKVHFLKGGTIFGRFSVGGVLIGDGFAGRATPGFSTMTVSLNAKGRTILSAATGPLTITVKYAFRPNGKGKVSSSTVTVTTLG